MCTLLLKYSLLSVILCGILECTGLVDLYACSWVTCIWNMNSGLIIIWHLSNSFVWFLIYFCNVPKLEDILFKNMLFWNRNLYYYNKKIHCISVQLGYLASCVNRCSSIPAVYKVLAQSHAARTVVLAETGGQYLNVRLFSFDNHYYSNNLKYFQKRMISVYYYFNL